jgi:adenylate kinase
VARELLVERAVLRRTDKKTGAIYHLKYNPPPPDADLEHRADDQEQTVNKRLDAYEQMTAALLPYYEKKGLLRRVDGVGKPAEVTERMLAVLNRG